MRRAGLAVAAALLAGCGGAEEPRCAGGCPPDEPEWPDHLPYAKAVIDVAFGAGAGFGQDDLPDVVLGPPAGRGPGAGSLDVLSLGVGGEIVLGFGDREIVDGPGPDLVVFENPFEVATSTAIFVELGAVAVSTDAVSWHTFPCGPRTEAGRYPGCAGWTPTLEFDPVEVDPIDPDRTGGDRFDLAELGLEVARYVRITDLQAEGEAPTAGFDLDAVGAVHLRPRLP